MPDNFVLGLNLFCLGSLEADTMVQQRQLNQHADALCNGDAAAPSLIVALQDSKQDIYIPRTFAQLRYLIERSEALWLVLLGSHHPVTQQYHDYKQYLSTHEHRLERIVPTDLKMRYMTPALLARRIQLATNSWLTTQARTALPCTFIGLTDIFLEIDLGKQWEPPFPSQYISNPAQAALSSFASPVTPSIFHGQDVHHTDGSSIPLNPCILAMIAG